VYEIVTLWICVQCHSVASNNRLLWGLLWRSLDTAHLIRALDAWHNTVLMMHSSPSV